LLGVRIATAQNSNGYDEYYSSHFLSNVALLSIVSFSVAIRANSYRIFYAIFAAVGQRYYVVDFKKRTAIRLFLEWRLAITVVTYSIRLKKHLRNNVGISIKNDCFPYRYFWNL